MWLSNALDNDGLGKQILIPFNPTVRWLYVMLTASTRRRPTPWRRAQNGHSYVRPSLEDRLQEPLAIHSRRHFPADTFNTHVTLPLDVRNRKIRVRSPRCEPITAPTILQVKDSSRAVQSTTRREPRTASTSFSERITALNRLSYSIDRGGLPSHGSEMLCRCLTGLRSLALQRWRLWLGGVLD